MFANPYAPVTAHDGGAWIVVVPAIGAAGIVAAIAALLSARRTLVALFLVSFFPFGLYLMATPSIWRWFGAMPIGYLAAASLLKSKA